MKRAVLFLCLVVAPATIFAQWHGSNAPDSLSFQGQLTKPDGTPIDTSVAMTFALYKGSTKVWEQTHGSVTVTDGVFNVILGGSGAASLDTVAFNEPIDVGVKVGNNSEMTPRTPLAAAAYALGMRGMYAVSVNEYPYAGVNVIGGARNNVIGAGFVGATISGGGGWQNSSSKPDSVVGDFGTVGGGNSNTAGDRATVSGGIENRAMGQASAIGGGQKNETENYAASIGGGYNNRAGYSSSVAGGENNQANGYAASIGGGNQNVATGSQATIGGGYQNEAPGQNSAVPGGSENTAAGGYSFAAGQGAKANHSGTFVWADSANSGAAIPFASTDENQFLIRASGGVGIGTNAPANQLSVSGNADISGYLGLGTDTPARLLHIRGDQGVIRVDREEAQGATSILLHQYDAGTPDVAWKSFAINVDADGVNDGVLKIQDLQSAVGGGGTIYDRLTIANNGFVALNTTSTTYPLQVGTGGSNGGGAHLTTGGVWTDASSRTFKTNFENVDSHDILERLAALPIATWEYKDSDEGRHMGPVAEDFHEAFGLGDNERYISGTDARGVSMAAIQGLYDLVKEQAAVITMLTERVSELESGH